MDFILYNSTGIFVITFFVITVFLLIGTRKSIGKVNQKNFFSIDQTNWFKGIAIVWIAYSHYYKSIGTSFLLCGIGGFGVGMFFLCSGYGLTVSKIKKKDYHKGFLKNKLLRIYAPYIVAFIVEWLMVFLIPVECNDNILINFLIISLPNAVIWYLKVQVIMYIIYYIAMLIWKDDNKKICISIVVLSVIYIIIGCLTKIPGYWYQNTLWFPIGIFIAVYKASVFEFIQEHFGKLLIISLAIFVVGFGLIYFIGGSAIYDMIMTNGAVACMLLLCTKISGDSKIMQFMGKYSIEIYLSHSIVGMLFSAYFNIDNLVLAFVFMVASAFVAVPIKFLSNKIVAITNKFIGQ